MSLLEQTFDDSIYHDESFKTILEDHLPLLSNIDNIQEVKEVSPVDANRYEYDFYGLLRYLAIPIPYHWITMRVNGLMSPNEYRKNMLTIKIPSIEIFEGLKTYHSQVAKRTNG